MSEESPQKMHLQQPPPTCKRSPQNNAERLNAPAGVVQQHLQTGASSSPLPPPSPSASSSHPRPPRHQKHAHTTLTPSTNPSAPSHPSDSPLQQKQRPPPLQPLPLLIPQQNVSARIHRHQRDLEELLHRAPDATTRIQLCQEKVCALIAQPGDDGGHDTDAREGIKLFVRAAEEQVPTWQRVGEVEIVQKQQVQLRRREERVGWQGGGRINAAGGEREWKKGGWVVTSGRYW